VIASRLGLVIVWACVGVLAAALWLDLRRVQPAPDREIAPFVESMNTKSIVWDRAAIPIRIERDPMSSTGWKWVDPVGDADRQTVEDLLATLRGARWHRRAKMSAAGTLSTRVAIEYEAPSFTQSTTLTITVGEPLPGGDQQWIVVESPFVGPEPTALLVDTWVVRALVPDPVALRLRRPFANVASANELEMGTFILRGTPRRIVKLAGLPADLYANPALVDDFERALGDVTTLAIPRGRVPIDTNFRGTRVAVSGKLVAVEAGRCPDPNRDLHAIVGPSIGPSCVSEAAWTKLLAAAAVFDLRDEGARQRALATLVEPRPIPVEPSNVTFSDGSVLQLAKRPQIVDKTGNHDADPARVAELLAVLATPGEPIALPTTPQLARLVVVGPRSEQPAIVLALYGNGVIARTGEPIALRVGAGSYEILARGGRAYVDPTLWAEDPMTIASIKIGDVTYTRGVVIGEWTRQAGGGVIDAASVDTLAGALASPRSLGAATAAANPRTVVITIKAPIGAPRTRTIGIARGATCIATIDGVSHGIDAQLCALVDALAR
jgi:hypothetical protein